MPSARDTVENVLDHWTRTASLPAELLDPEIEWVNPPDAVEPGTRRGRDGWEQAEESWRGSFTSVRFEIERIAEDGDRVAAAVRCHSVAGGSGMEIDQVLGFLWTVRAGRLVRFEWSNDPDEIMRRLA
jgi:ketosteroid isomerase-like protein